MGGVSCTKISKTVVESRNLAWSLLLASSERILLINMKLKKISTKGIWNDPYRFFKVRFMN